MKLIFDPIWSNQVQNFDFFDPIWFDLNFSFDFPTPVLKYNFSLKIFHENLESMAAIVERLEHENNQLRLEQERLVQEAAMILHDSS